MSCPRSDGSGEACIDYIRRWDADEDDKPLHTYDEQDADDEREQQELDESR